MAAQRGTARRPRLARKGLRFVPGGDKAFGAGALAQVVGGLASHSEQPCRLGRSCTAGEFQHEAELPGGGPAVVLNG